MFVSDWSAIDVRLMCRVFGMCMCHTAYLFQEEPLSPHSLDHGASRVAKLCHADFDFPTKPEITSSIWYPTLAEKGYQDAGLSP